MDKKRLGNMPMLDDEYEKTQRIESTLHHTPKVVEKESRRKWCSYEEVKKLIHSLKIQSKEEFERIARQKELPPGIPSHPDRVYKDKEWNGWPDFLGYESQFWSITKIKELLRSLIDSGIIKEWGSDEAVLYRILHTKGLLNLKNNRHSEFFKNLPIAVHTKEAFKEIQEYANSNTGAYAEEIPPDLTKYNRIFHNKEENENIGTMSVQELTKAVETEGRDPLNYTYFDSIQAPNEILTSIERIQSIIADEETMRFLVTHSVNKLWKRIIEEYDNEDPKRIADVIAGIKKNGNHYNDEVVEQFLTDYNGSVNIRNNLPKGYSFPYKPKIMQAYVAHKLKTSAHFLNLSGVGSGKTLSAILASRIANNGENRMTVVVCLNDIVEQWDKDIRKAFPDSNVIKRKDAFYAKRDENKSQYLILNYEKFSQDNSSNLILELGKQKIDFVIIDEIHYVKVRGGDSPLTKEDRYANRIVSQRHTNLVGLMTEIRERNKEVRVLGMTATPVINDLMEGRSLIELVTGTVYDDVSVSRPACQFRNPNILSLNLLYLKLLSHCSLHKGLV